MGNIITFHRAGGDLDLHFGNGPTDAFLAMLILSGSSLASTDAERRLIVYLAGRDQTLYGRGMVGFSINDMPWILDDLPEQKRFMIATVDGALARTGWDKVENFTPDVAFYDGQLRALRAMFADFRAEHVAIMRDEDGYEDEWVAPDEFVRCAHHGALMYDFDWYHCFLCHYDFGSKAPCCQRPTT